MRGFYKSYLRAFQKYAQSFLDKPGSVKNIARYAQMINMKANQLLRRATLNKMEELPKFQKELFESGRDYVQKFSAHLKKRILQALSK